MTDDAFRIMLLAAFVCSAPFAIRGRIRSFTDERLDRWQEGVVVLFGLRLSAAALFLCVLAWMINPRSMDWSSLALPDWLRCVGIGLVVCSGSLVAWTFANLGKNLTDTVVTRREHYLVTTGPYRYVRHPFYLAFALGLIGVSLAMANWLIPLVGAVPLGFIVARTTTEERKLIDRFGAEYEAYMRRVPRFVPFWR